MNTTAPNVTLICSQPQWLQTILVCFGVVVIVQNVLMIVVILRHPRLRTAANIIVTSLAVTDAVVGLGTLTYTIVRNHLLVSAWYIKYFNKAAANINLGMILCSYLHVTALAMERYIYIGHPFFYFTYIGEKFIFKLVLGFWAFIIVFILSAFICGEIKDSCLFKDMFTPEAVYVMYSIEVLLLLVTSLSYFKIAHISLKHRRSVAARCSNVTGNPIDITARFSSENWAAVRKTIRFYLIMTSSLAIMTLPASLCAFVNAINQSVNTGVFGYLMLLPFVQSAVNFYINLFMNSDFRNAIKQLCSLKRYLDN